MSKPRDCFHDFQMCCMLNGSPCDDGFNGIMCDCFIPRKTGKKKIAEGKRFSMSEMKFVDKKEDKDSEIDESLSETWDD